VLSSYVWAPLPFSLKSQQKAATDNLNHWVAELDKVVQVESQVAEVQGRFQEKGQWVGWVDEADKIPELWRRYFNLVIKYIPDDVVISGLPLPSGNVLSLSGQTSDLRAATRWYLNMLRCEMVQPDPSAVTFSTPTVGWPGEMPQGANPKMQQQVNITIALNPDYNPMNVAAAAPPAAAGIGGGRGVVGVGGAGRMGARGGPGLGGRGGMGGRGGAGMGGRGGAGRGGRGGAGMGGGMMRGRGG